MTDIERAELCYRKDKIVKTHYLILIISVVMFLGCRDENESLEKNIIKEKNILVSNEPPSSETSELHKIVTYNNKKAHHWEITSNPEARLIHGWVSFTESNGVIQINEHVGGGSKKPLDESLALILIPHVKENFLHLQMVENYKDRSKNVESKTKIPTGSTIDIIPVKQFSGLTKEWQILWQAHFKKTHTNVISVAYLVRLLPLLEESDGFGREEIARILPILLKRNNR